MERLKQKVVFKP